MNLIALSTALTLLTLAPLSARQQSAGDDKTSNAVHDMRLCPAQNDHEHMNERGAVGMGFSQSSTAHHFLIQANGGAIRVTAKDPHDQASRDSIRHHLQHISQAFANSDFDIPMFVHDTTPPGVPEMKTLRKEVSYTFEELPDGGQVVIRTANPRALAAIHKFLKFQIEEHQTGDTAVAPVNK
jgi:hypothetical protein